MTYELWEKEPAPNRGGDWEIGKAGGTPFDEDWERWSYPIGNGYVGANVFGRTDVERIQIADKGFHNGGRKRFGSFTSFMELYLDVDHKEAQEYRRSLHLEEGIAHVSYTHQGVHYSRELFASYPDKLIVVHLTADQSGALSFRVRPEIPYLDHDDQKSGSITVKEDLLTLAGTDGYFHCNYEGQIKVLHQGGTRTNDPTQGTITVTNADTATLLIATGTNYRLNQGIFLNPQDQKLDPDLFPHEEVSSRINAAAALEVSTLKQRHVDDVTNLTARASVRLTATPSKLPTSELLNAYQQGDCDLWLEELMFHYGRYLLIASSREKSLPANLQGTWTQYYASPWTSGYWHNINVQMNYWGVMSTNLAECFEGYSSYFEAVLPKAREHATDYVRENAPDRLTEDDTNGWIVGTGATAYFMGAPGGHSGPGTGGFTSKLFMEYYLYSQDTTFLKEVAYPILRELSVFYLKALREHGDVLLVEPSSSPEQYCTEEQVEGMPGHILRPKNGKGHYGTVGCAFDQGFVWENFNDTLILAKEVGEEDAFLEEIRDAMNRLDPIQIGASGQIKEYREEVNYSDIGDPHHRHISHLCPLYPGTLISSHHEDWMEAARTTLDLRGNKTTGWAMAHRMNCRARLKQGDEAHKVFRQFIQERAVPNLWTLHPPFQIDGNFGTMAGIAEMLVQSHEGFIDILPALPEAWPSGSFSGLVARGNFVISAEWNDSQITHLSITSRKGGECHIKCEGLEDATVATEADEPVSAEKTSGGILTFPTTENSTYTITFA